MTINYSKIFKEEGNIRKIEYRGMRGVILRIRPESSGHLCGYVKISKGKSKPHYDEYNSKGIEVHGGLTFSGELPEMEGYWIGFDCAHSGDLMPMSQGRDLWESLGYTYKDMSYVEGELRHLIDQVKELSQTSELKERAE